jgi:hypothetical protein
MKIRTLCLPSYAVLTYYSVYEICLFLIVLNCIIGITELKDWLLIECATLVTY